MGEKSYRRSEQRKFRRRRQRTGNAVFASLAVMILGGLFVFGAEPFSNASSETEVVQRSEPPTVAQAPEAVKDAKAEEASDEQASAESERSEEKASDKPAENKEAEEEPAEEPAVVPVPDIPYNATEEEAREMLEKNDLELGEVKKEPNDDYDEGGVFWQDPLPDVEVEEGSEVGITLSSGPPPESETEEDPQDPATTELYLSVPKMGLSGDPVANATDEGTLMNGAGKITDTGFPWQPNANTYIASHVYGYEGTGSWQHFAALPTMTYGDEVILSDANGTEYVYEVTNVLTVAPTDTWVTEPVEGKDMVSLQTCVGPGWSERLVVQAERVDVAA